MLDTDDPGLVRPFVITQGRTRPAGATVPVEAAVCQTPAWPGPVPALGLVEMQIWMAAADRPSSAQISARLDLPVGVVRVLVGDLVAAGLAHIGPVARPDDIELVRRLIDGIRRL